MFEGRALGEGCGCFAVPSLAGGGRTFVVDEVGLLDLG